MADQISDGVRKLFEEANIGHLATVMPDGSPQVTPVWVDFDGEHILVNTAEDRQKPRNIRRDPRVAISVTSERNPFAYAQVRGRVVEVTREGAEEHIDRLAKKYLGRDTYPFRRPGERRIILKIAPEHVSSMGAG
ncbi:MAG: PPOX class F420-dependent oxidoreductase [Dehalococcoidia bacterium]|jgi:PPOX class probable F420-dependent enzyme